MLRMSCIRDWTTSQYGSRGIDCFALRAMQPFPLFSLFLSTDDLLSSNILLKRDTLRDRLSSPLQRCHRRVHSPERTTPPHHTAHRCTCRWRKTNLPSAPCTPDDKWARDVHNPADPNRE